LFKQALTPCTSGVRLRRPPLFRTTHRRRLRRPARDGREAGGREGGQPSFLFDTFSVWTVFVKSEPKANTHGHAKEGFWPFIPRLIPCGRPSGRSYSIGPSQADSTPSISTLPTVPRCVVAMGAESGRQSGSDKPGGGVVGSADTPTPTVFFVFSFRSLFTMGTRSCPTSAPLS